VLSPEFAVTIAIATVGERHVQLPLRIQRQPLVREVQVVWLQRLRGRVPRLRLTSQSPTIAPDRAAPDPAAAHPAAALPAAALPAAAHPT